MGAGHKQPIYEILVFGGSGGLALAASTLRLINIQRLGLGVARVRERDHHILLSDQILGGEIELIFQNLGTARIPKLVDDLRQLLSNHLHQTRYQVTL